MGTGYTRNDTSNNIADGNIINASDLDGEFDAIESAMSTSGHTHDGTSAEGGPVTVVGPAQDLVVTASEVKPKTDNTLDLGTSSLQFKNAYFQGTVDTDGIMTAATFEPDGDTAAGDNAAIGYTAAEGLILTGQGSTSDITFKNDADTTVFSIPTGTDDVLFPDNAKAMFGAGSDLSVYHDGTRSHVEEAGLGGLWISTNGTEIKLKQGGGVDEDMLVATPNGSVDLYYNNNLKLATTSTGISVTGNATFADNGKAIFGAGSDLEIYHDGSNSYIHDGGTGDLRIRGGNDIHIRTPDDENYIVCNQNDSVQLFYDGSAKLATTSTGIDVTGTVTADGLTVDGDGLFDNDTAKITVKSFQPKLILDDDSAVGAGSDKLIIQSASSQSAGDYEFVINNDQTSSADQTAIKISGNGDISFYEDTGSTAKLTWDASAESLKFADDGQAIFGDSSDLTIEHNGTNSTITNATGTLTIQNTADDEDVDIVSDDGSGGTAVYFRADGSSGQAKLYHNNAGTGTLRLNTSSDGIDITGHADIEGHFTATDGCTITTADNSTQLTLTSTDADSSEGPRLDLRRDSASPANGDLIGTIRYLGDDDGGTTTVFGEIQLEADAIADGSESGQMRLMIRNNGTLRNAVVIDATEVLFNQSNDDVDFRVESDTNTHALFVQGSSGNVGIKTDSPATALDVRGEISVDYDATYGLRFYNEDRNNWSSIGNPTATGDSTANLVFKVSSGEAMRIDSSGNVGIGTTSVIGKLHANDSSGATLTLTRTSGATSGNLGKLRFGNTNVDSALASIVAIQDGATNNSAITFGTQSSGAAEVVRMKIDSSGNTQLGSESSVTGGRYFDIYNTASGATDFSILRFITQQVGSSSTVSADIYKRKNGQFTIANGETHADAFTSFNVGASERARFSSSGHLLVGKTTDSSAVHGGEIRSTGQMVAAVDGNWAGLFNRETSDGEILRFKKDDTTVGSISCSNSGSYIYFGSSAESVGLGYGGGFVFPTTGGTTGSDSSKDFGSPSYRWDDIYASNGTIQTSDRNEKQDIAELTDAEKRVAVAAKGLLRKFRWKSAVAEKGEAARTHFGIIAQDLQAAFAAEGLDAGDYAMFISSTWTDEETGEERTRMGVRYSELLAFIIAAI